MRVSIDFHMPSWMSDTRRSEFVYWIPQLLNFLHNLGFVKFHFLFPSKHNIISMGYRVWGITN